MYEIKKGVPLPPRKLPSTKSRFPIAEMEVGDMFEVRGSEYSGVTSYANKHGKATGKKFESRRLKLAATEAIYGIWRTE